MRVIHLKNGHQYQYDSEFNAVNRDRVDNDITLEFYLANCDCGAQGLYLVEQANMKVDYFKAAEEMIPNPTYEIIDLKCPADCGGSLRMAFTNVHPTHGLKIRCLEAWTRRVEVQGLEQEPERHNHGHSTPHGITVHHHPDKDSVEVDIHLHIPYSATRGADGRHVIVEALCRKLETIPYSRDFLK